MARSDRQGPHERSAGSLAQTGRGKKGARGRDEGSIAQQVRRYIDKRPVVRDALRMGIVNLSALTRQIQEHTGITQDDAVLVACRRYIPDDGGVSGYQDAVREMLEGSKLEVRTHVVVWTLRPSWRLFGRLEQALRELRGSSSAVHVLHGSEALTVIADRGAVENLEKVLDDGDLLTSQDGLVEVNLRTPNRIEDVPGVLSFVASALSGRGVNFVEVISCHKDNMFVIDAEDLFEAFEVLQTLTSP